MLRVIRIFIQHQMQVTGKNYLNFSIYFFIVSVVSAAFIIIYCTFFEDQTNSFLISKWSSFFRQKDLQIHPPASIRIILRNQSVPLNQSRRAKSKLNGKFENENETEFKMLAANESNDTSNSETYRSTEMFQPFQDFRSKYTKPKWILEPKHDICIDKMAILGVISHLNELNRRNQVFLLIFRSFRLPN